MQITDKLIDNIVADDSEAEYRVRIATGEVVTKYERGVYDDAEGLLALPGLSTYENVRSIMNQFAETLEPSAQHLLMNELGTDRPVREFKDALYNLNLWKEWLAFKHRVKREQLEAWLNEHQLRVH
ncbi:hypothetical protein EBB07_33945 [Paenibacillaceae bacterium]|nr:hypothetical protein EBB07_33945 [Paenibacillaceae bacterium]